MSTHFLRLNWLPWPLLSWSVGLRSLFLALIAPLLLATIASANAPPPPDYLWFTFVDAANHPVEVQNLQVVECNSARCDQPRLLQQTGTCTAPGCLPSPPKLIPFASRLECAGNTCLYEGGSGVNDKTQPRLKLIAQFPDRVRSSQGIGIRFGSPLATGASGELRVTVRETDLAIAPDPNPQKPSRLVLFGLALAVTQATELGVAALFLRKIRIEQPSLITTLLAIAVVNLITFPVVWFFFPALQPFQYNAARTFGAITAGMAIVYSLFLLRLAPITRVRLRNFFFGWLLSLPFVLLIGGLSALLTGYGQWLPESAGVPSSLTLPASELFAVVWEAGLIYRLRPSELSLRQAAGLSLIMNIASLLLGLALFPALHTPR